MIQRSVTLLSLRICRMTEGIPLLAAEGELINNGQPLQMPRRMLIGSFRIRLFSRQTAAISSPFLPHAFTKEGNV